METFDYQQAVELLQQIVKTDSVQTEALWLLGRCYAQLGQNAAARQAVGKLLMKEQEHKPARALLGQLYLKEANYAKAAACYDLLLKQDSTNAYFYRQRAFTADKAGDVNAALNYYRKAVALAPQDIESTVALAELLSKLEDNVQAAGLVQQGLSQDSSNIRLWQLQARLSYKVKDYEGVIRAMKYPLSAGDSSLYYLQLLGISHFHLSNFEEAIRWLGHLQLEGVETEVLFYYLGLSYRNAGDTGRGIEYLEKATKQSVSENLSHYYTQLAVTYEEKGDYSNAIRSFQLAHKASGDKTLLYHLARNYDMHYKDKQVALNYYQKYLSETDSANAKYQEYARYRASQLKEHIHFSIDTL